MLPLGVWKMSREIHHTHVLFIIFYLLKPNSPSKFTENWRNSSTNLVPNFTPVEVHQWRTTKFIKIEVKSSKFIHTFTFSFISNFLNEEEQTFKETREQQFHHWQSLKSFEALNSNLVFKNHYLFWLGVVVNNWEYVLEFISQFWGVLVKIRLGFDWIWDWNSKKKKKKKKTYFQKL